MAIMECIERLDVREYWGEREMELDYTTVKTMLLHYNDEKIVTYGKKIVPQLINALGDTDWNVRRNAFEALEKIGKDAVIALFGPLEDPQYDIRANAAKILGCIAEKTELPEAIGPLIKLIEEASWRITDDLIDTIGKIVDKTTIPTSAIRSMIELLKSGVHNEEKIIEVLEKIGKGAVEPLIEALGDTDWSQRTRAETTLKRITDERGVRFAKIIGKKDVDYALKIGLKETLNTVSEFVRMFRHLERSTDVNDIVRLRDMKRDLAEFYSEVVAEYNKKNAAIKVEGGELLRDTVKPPNGNNGMYRTIREKTMERKPVRLT